MRTPSPSLAILGAILLAAVPATAQIQRPLLGYMLDSENLLRPILDTAASASLGAPTLAGATSFACAATACLAKTSAALVTFASGNPPAMTPCACPGTALLALDPPALSGGAWIYFQTSRQFARWRSGAFAAIDFDPGGEIVGLRSTSGGFDYAVARQGFDTPPREASREPLQDAGAGHRTSSSITIWIEHYSVSDASVTLLDSIHTTGAVLLLDAGILYASGDQLTLRRPDGSELAFSLAGANSFSAVADGYVEIAAAGGMWLLRTDPGKEQLFLLPGAPQTPLDQAPPRGVR